MTCCHSFLYSCCSSGTYRDSTYGYEVVTLTRTECEHCVILSLSSLVARSALFTTSLTTFYLYLTDPTDTLVNSIYHHVQEEDLCTCKCFCFCKIL